MKNMIYTIRQLSISNLYLQTEMEGGKQLSGLGFLFKPMRFQPLEIHHKSPQLQPQRFSDKQDQQVDLFKNLRPIQGGLIDTKRKNTSKQQQKKSIESKVKGSKSKSENDKSFKAASIDNKQLSKSQNNSKKPIIQQQVVSKKVKTKILKDKPAQESEKIDKKVSSQNISRKKQTKQLDLSNKEKEPLAMQQQEKQEAPINFIQLDRKWTDPINNQKKGKFQVQQKKIIAKTVAHFLAINAIDLAQFRAILAGSKDDKRLFKRQKFYKLLSSALPRRSPGSCYRYILRNYSADNHQGDWNQDQVDRLLSLVQRFGRKWKLIGAQMGRTSDNVYDKYRSLGQQSLGQRQSFWSLKQLTQLLIEVQKQTKIQFLDHNLKKELKNQKIHDMAEKAQLQLKTYNSKKFTFHNMQLVIKYIKVNLLKRLQLSKIKWQSISNQINTKSPIDCRNKIVQLLQVAFRNNSKLDKELIEFLKQQPLHEQNLLNWEKWKKSQFSVDQAINRLMILKKIVEGRSRKTYREIVRQIVKRVQDR